MKKIKILLIVLLLLLLNGCDSLLFGGSLVDFDIQNNIKIAISEYAEFDWSKVITVKYDNKIIDFSQVNVRRISGEIKVGETCKHEVSYQPNFTKYSATFDVRIVNDEYLIKDIYSVKINNQIATKGTVNLVTDSGFILTDDTASIYIKSNNDIHPIKKDDVIEVDINITSNGFILNSYKKITRVKSLALPLNINTTNDLYYFNQDYNGVTTLIRIEGTITQKDDDLYIIQGSSNFKLDMNSEILSHIDKKVIVSLWVYKKDVNNYCAILSNIDHVYSQNTSGSKPTVKTQSDYYCYYDKDNIKNLTSYFTATDSEDGKITPTQDMITGSLNEEINLITIKVTDSNNNVTFSDIIIEISNYTGVETNESVSIIDPYCMPTSGDVKVLVIPIGFSGKPATEEMKNNITKAFFGNEEDTGWESLTSYYQESSYGKLNISGSVTDWYSPKYSPSYYASYEDNDYITGSTLLMVEALKYFKNDYNYSDFDSNEDGYIDAVYLIYNYDIGGNKSYAEEDFYWAYTFWDTNADYRYYGNTKAYSYVFIGYDFFKQNLAYSSEKININCETLIHETGHLFNLEDYYDYDEYDDFRNNGGYCGSDMMDNNFGDHGPLSKILLDWINPVEITKSGIYELPMFSSSGVSFVIGANDNFDSIFDEYYLIDFYDFNGLNELQCKSFFKTNNNYAGIRISHVDAGLTYEDGYFPIFTNNNTNTKHKIVQMLEADYRGTFHLSSSKNTGAQLSDFYQVGDTFGTDFYTYYKSHNNNNIPFTMKVIDITNNIATVEITLK